MFLSFGEFHVLQILKITCLKTVMNKMVLLASIYPTNGETMETTICATFVVIISKIRLEVMIKAKKSFGEK